MSLLSVETSGTLEPMKGTGVNMEHSGTQPSSFDREDNLSLLQN